MVESTADRKKRLGAMKSKAKATGAAQEGGAVEEEEEQGHSAKKMKFRNYLPHDAKLGSDSAKTDKETEESASESKGGDGDRKSKEMNKGKKVETGVDLIQQELAAFDAKDDVKVLPQKPDQDLRMQVDGRLKKLKKRTQRAIVDILREKLKANEED